MDLEGFLHEHLNWMFFTGFAVMGIQMSRKRVTFRTYLITATGAYVLGAYLECVRGTLQGASVYAVGATLTGTWAYFKRPPRQPVPDGSHERL